MRPTFDEILAKKGDPIGPPQLMMPTDPSQDKFGIRVAFPVDQVSRVGFEKLYQENRDYILQQAMANREKKSNKREEGIDLEKEYLDQIEESIQFATRKKNDLLIKQRDIMDRQNKMTMDKKVAD